MLRAEKLDVVSICLWPHLHAEAVIACAKAGVRAVHSEKPMAPTWGEALKLAAAYPCAAKLWLAAIARSVVLTNPGQATGNDSLRTPRNQPLDDALLLDSWRQKGLSEDRISKAQRESTMGYERVKDPQTGRIYEMPLETWDDTLGGYRNPRRPEEILQPAAPGE